MLSDGEISYLYDGFGRFEQVTKADGSITHVINGEEKESGELPQEDVQSRVLNYYEYDAFGNTIRCEEQVHKRFRYTGEQYDILTGQYYLRARYYNPVIARFTQEDTYYGDGLNLYTYCQNNPVLYHDPTGHGTKENSPYSRKEQQYIDAGADPDTARLAAECYPDAKSKQDLYNKYKSQGYNATDAKKLANYEIVHGEERAKNYAANNVKKSGPDYTATFPRDNVNTDWRTQERVNAQRNAGAGKGNESGNKSGSGSTTGENARILSNNLAREGRPVGNGEAAAHIVASNGTKRQWASAADSRTLLMKYDIDINDAANGIPLGHPRPHNLTHNRAFHENVNARLHTVETDMLNNGYGKSAIRSALRRELRSIGREFENGIRN
jgi:RHS repeat-associated protein